METVLNHTSASDSMSGYKEDSYMTRHIPDSFLLYTAKRKNEITDNGEYVSSSELSKMLSDEWEAMSKEQRDEYQNQSQCIQFTLGIENRSPSKNHHSPIVNQLINMKKVVPSSMVIPNDHSLHSPSSKDDDGYFNTDKLYHSKQSELFDNTDHNSYNHYNTPTHHSLSDNSLMLIDTPCFSSNYSHDLSPIMNGNSASGSSSSSGSSNHSYFYSPASPTDTHHYHHHHHQQQQQQSQSQSPHHPPTQHLIHHNQSNSPISLSPPSSSSSMYNHQDHHDTIHNGSYGNNNHNHANNRVGGYNILMSNLSYSAAAEAAALESLTCNNSLNMEKSVTTNNHLSNPSTTKRKYGTHPEKVKRPPNAYLLFNRDMRRQLHDVNQGLSSGEISKSISRRWKQLSKEEKEGYIKEEARLKQENNLIYSCFIYNRRSKAEMEEAGLLKKLQQKSSSGYQGAKKIQLSRVTVKKTPKEKQTGKDETRRDPRGRKKKEADDSLPKHPMSAYLHFAKEMRPVMKKKYPQARLVEISKLIGSEWRSMESNALQMWVDVANQDKARYAREMKDRHNRITPTYHQNIIIQQQDTGPEEEEEDTHSSTYLFEERKLSALTMEELDSHTIATVAQMVNPSSKRQK